MDGVLLLMYCYNLVLAMTQVMGMQWRVTALTKIRRQRKDRIVQRRQEE